MLINQDLLRKFTNQEIDAAGVQEAVQQDTSDAAMTEEQAEKELKALVAKLNTIIKAKAAERKTGISLNDPTIQKIIALFKKMNMTEEQAHAFLNELFTEDNTYNYYATMPDYWYTYDEMQVEFPAYTWIATQEAPE